ncbi:tellurite resistance/C4-dicarboxylate transporter family protein [Streptomyces sp. NPDC017940]|uniref:tellurite resistance/C4-dicarboxylate transporter family protein n=1 Tax=Streptomyces sp. NPDC017940 TaxID=3365017 RepID=UPI00378E91E4
MTEQGRTGRRGAAVPRWCREPAPACFAPVMATGIVSRALARPDTRGVSQLLFGVACALYCVLLTATVAKYTHCPDRLRSELRDPARVFGHFTFVAACGVLAARLTQGPARCAGWMLLALAGALWPVLALCVLRILRTSRWEAAEQADGTWFLLTVGLQSLVVALTGLHPGGAVTLVGLPLWCTGVLLYTATFTAVVRRLLRNPPGPARFTPVYWVAMGAAAISILAGARLLAPADVLPGPVRALLGGAVVALWGWATALIPVLLAAGAWRHLRHRVPLAYEPALWCVVFPAGMYATATAQLAGVRHIPALAAAGGPLAWAATAAWLAVQIRCVTARVRRGG